MKKLCVSSLFIRGCIVLACTFASVAISAALMFSVSAADASSGNFSPAPGGTPMYAWGINDNGQLGLGDDGVGTNRLSPTRVGGADNWVQVSSAQGGAAARNADGYIYTWGNNWTTPQMGQGDHPTPGVGNIVEPTRVGEENDWIFVGFSGNIAAAINEEGYLYTWGANHQGQLGHGHFNSENVPRRVGGAEARNDWAQIALAGANNFMVGVTEGGDMYAWGNNSNGQLGRGYAGGGPFPTPQPVETPPGVSWTLAATAGAYVMAITTDGELFGWGLNNYSQLGLGDNTDRHEPTQIGDSSNWVDVVTTPMPTHVALALNSDGHLYSWGGVGAANTYGIGRPTDVDPAELPGRVGDRSDWVAIGGGNSHFLVMTENYGLYAWGSNAQGQLGDNSNDNAIGPIPIMQAFAMAGFSQMGAGQFSLALIKSEPPEDATLYLDKHLRMPVGTTLPAGGRTFIFDFVPYSFNGNTAQANQVPQIGTNGEIAITVTNASDYTEAGGVITRTESRNVLANVPFTGPGVYSWRVTERINSSNSTFPSNMVYSAAEYQLNVWVSQIAPGAPLVITVIEKIPVIIDNPTQTVGDKTNYLIFTNTYTRITEGTDDCEGPLVVSKTVSGRYADLSIVFNFTVTMTRTAMCPENRVFTARIFGADDVQVGGTLSFPTGAPTPVELRHGQRLVFDEFLVGTSFLVVESAIINFTASVDLVVNGTPTTVAPNLFPNTALSTGTHIAGENENSAAFTNTHFRIPTTGLEIVGIPLAIPVILVILAMAGLSVRRRRNIEQMPLI